MPQTWEQYDDGQERSQAARCLLCGEPLRDDQERAEVVLTAPVGDTEYVERGPAHAECYLAQRDHHEGRLELA